MSLGQSYILNEFTLKNNELFFDTYALYEIIKGNVNYKKYLESEIITSKLNIFELYHIIMKKGDIILAGSSLDKYYPYVADFDEEVIKEASSFKITFNKRNVSMVDCIGYCMAKQLGIKFLTGDKEFENLPNVEFVK